MTRGNIAEEMGGMVPGPAATSALKIMYESEDGIIQGYTSLTAFSTLTAAADAGVYRFAPRCMIMCINSDAANSIALVWNTGLATAPAFTGLIT